MYYSKVMQKAWKIKKVVTDTNLQHLFVKNDSRLNIDYLKTKQACQVFVHIQSGP